MGSLTRCLALCLLFASAGTISGLAQSPVATVSPVEAYSLNGWYQIRSIARSGLGLNALANGFPVPETQPYGRITNRQDKHYLIATPNGFDLAQQVDSSSNSYWQFVPQAGLGAGSGNPGLKGPVAGVAAVAAPVTRVKGCEEGFKLVNGKCQKLTKKDRPQKCPAGTKPVQQTDNCVWKTDRNGFEIAPWKKPGCSGWKTACAKGNKSACSKYESTCQVN
jgi:uncharacterized protein YbdZ (MbtH family)